ncbi:MAG: hypothetical protein HFF96_07325 [Oscillibacter sp.]|uniref:hypothetical protein n=1 Tax=Oscillibacter sp. TaxID=1945593 RepID=UPI00216EACDF|nr:hypothetical protein [Oscillibacter sp.]MCI9114054.1 hypothetical protein [Oscillibacter sp.]
MVVVTSCGCVKFFAVFARSSMADTSCANVYVPVKADMLDGLRLMAGNVIKLAAKKEAAEGNGIPKEIQKELIRKKRQQQQTEAAPSEKGRILAKIPGRGYAQNDYVRFGL